MLLPGNAHGGSYTQLNNTHQGQTGGREGELERERSHRGGGRKDMATKKQRIKDRGREIEVDGLR